jgi:hypothetical protein
MCLHKDEDGQDFQNSKEVVPHNLLQGEIRITVLALAYNWQCGRQCEYT